MANHAGNAGKAGPESVFTARHDRRKVTDWVYEELKGAIVDLRLAPGDPLRFKGAVVTRYSRQDLLEIYELRELLENAAARAAAESMSEQDRARLDRISRESRSLQRGTDRANLAALISDFDAVLFDQVKNNRIRALIENLRAHLTRIGHLTAEIPGRIDASVDEHEKIVAAIAARDPQLAERYMREHIRSVRDDQLHALEETADHA